MVVTKNSCNMSHIPLTHPSRSRVSHCDRRERREGGHYNDKEGGHNAMPWEGGGQHSETGDAHCSAPGGKSCV